MRAERSTIQAFCVALALLVAGAVGFRWLVSELNIFQQKEAVALRRPLDSVPTKLGRWERVGQDSIFSDTLIEELGTRSYLDRTYALDGDARNGVVHVHVAYYTGTIDAIPHIPERCWAVSGLELTRNSEGTPIAIDRAAWEPLDPPAESGTEYFTVSLADPVTADLERVTMPVGDVVATTIEFQDPKAPEVRQAGGYFFIANGRLTSSSYGVRALAFNLTDRYAYYCKIQLTKTGRVKEGESLLTPFREDASTLLTELIPQVMRCLPDWPEWERRSREGSAGQASPAQAATQAAGAASDEVIREFAREVTNEPIHEGSASERRSAATKVPAETAPTRG